MRHLLTTTIIVLVSSQVLFAQQTVEKKFYSDKFATKTVEEKKAKVVAITINETDGTICNELKYLKNDKIIKRECFKDGYPTGNWVYDSGEEINYDFELLYHEKEFESLIHYNLKDNTTQEKIQGAFEPPIFKDNEGNVNLFIFNIIQYPRIAIENNIQGIVLVQFIVDENGKQSDLAIFKGIDKILDKEAARVVKQLTNWTPGKIDGKPVRTCILIPISFQLN